MLGRSINKIILVLISILVMGYILKILSNLQTLMFLLLNFLNQF